MRTNERHQGYSNERVFRRFVRGIRNEYVDFVKTISAMLIFYCQLVTFHE